MLSQRRLKKGERWILYEEFGRSQFFYLQPNGRWTTAQFYKNDVMVVFDAPSKEKAEAMIQATP